MSEPRRIDPNADADKLREALERQVKAADQAIAQWNAATEEIKLKDAEIERLSAWKAQLSQTGVWTPVAKWEAMLAELAQLRQAIGLMTTFKPDMIMRPDDPIGMAQEVEAEINTLRAAQVVTGETSDGYHTFNELYRHRCLLFAILLLDAPNAFKTWKNSEGETWEGWFIAGFNSRYGQITYHLPAELWRYLPITEHERNTAYDGHTSNDVADRLMKILHDQAY